MPVVSFTAYRISKVLFYTKGIYQDWKEPHRFILEANAPGIELHLISRRLEEFDGQVFWYPLKTEFGLYREKIAAWALTQVGVRYDFGSLFRNAVGRVSVGMRQYFCSEFGFCAYREAGLLSVDKAPRPGEFGRYGLHEKPVRIL